MYRTNVFGQPRVFIEHTHTHTHTPIERLKTGGGGAVQKRRFLPYVYTPHDTRVYYYYYTLLSGYNADRRTCAYW